MNKKIIKLKALHRGRYERREDRFISTFCILLANKILAKDVCEAAEAFIEYPLSNLVPVITNVPESIKYLGDEFYDLCRTGSAIMAGDILKTASSDINKRLLSRYIIYKHHISTPEKDKDKVYLNLLEGIEYGYGKESQLSGPGLHF